MVGVTGSKGKTTQVTTMIMASLVEVGARAASIGFKMQNLATKF